MGNARTRPTCVQRAGKDARKARGDHRVLAGFSSVAAPASVPRLSARFLARMEGRGQASSPGTYLVAVSRPHRRQQREGGGGSGEPSGRLARAILAGNAPTSRYAVLPRLLSLCCAPRATPGPRDGAHGFLARNARHAAWQQRRIHRQRPPVSFLSLLPPFPDPSLPVSHPNSKQEGRGPPQTASQSATSSFASEQLPNFLPLPPQIVPARNGRPPPAAFARRLASGACALHTTTAGRRQGLPRTRRGRRRRPAAAFWRSRRAAIFTLSCPSSSSSSPALPAAEGAGRVSSIL